MRFRGSGRRIRGFAVTMLCLLVAVCLAVGRTDAQAGGASDSGEETHTVASVFSYESGLAHEVLELVNQERKQAGLHPLEMERRLGEVALAKAKEMCERGYFDHISPYSGDLREQFERFGGIVLGEGAQRIGENIAWVGDGTQADVDAGQLMEMWMGSEGHRANILKAEYTHMGVAVCVGQGGAFAAQEFVAVY